MPAAVIATTSSSAATTIEIEGGSCKDTDREGQGGGVGDRSCSGLWVTEGIQPSWEVKSHLSGGPQLVETAETCSEVSSRLGREMGVGGVLARAAVSRDLGSVC